MIDLFLVYQFIRRLATPFEKWEAFELGIIDKNGNQLKKSKDFRTIKERGAWGKFDVMIAKLKKLLAKVPGGSSRIGSYAAALWLIKENNQHDVESLTEEQLMESFMPYLTLVESRQSKDINDLFEDAIANSAGSGNVDGIGVGPRGEPGLTKKQQKKYTKNAKPMKRFSDTI